MRYSWKQLSQANQGPRTVPLISGVVNYVRQLPPGDQLIASILGGLVALTLLAGLFGLERTFLVVEPAYGGAFTEGIVGTPRFVNPLIALSDADRDLAKLTYAGLMGTRGDGSLEPVLAESYSVSEDGKIYTFVLRPGITFSDGSPVTAEDVVFTVEKAQDPGLKSPELANWSGVKAEAVDARTVRFTLPRAYAPFLQDTTLGILPARLWRDVTNAEFPFSPLMSTPVGAGPFMVDRVTRSKEGVITEYTFKSFKGYALGRPYLDNIRFVFVDEESDLELALQNKRVDSGYGVAREGALTAPYARIFGAFFNANQNPVFSEPAVRRALSLAIDRSAITQSILGGYASPIMGPVPPGSGIETTPVPVLENRIQAAADVLTDAGWKYDEEARIWDNPKVDAELRVTLRTSNVPELKLVAQQVQSDWASLGVPTSLELFEPGDLTQNVIRPREYEALLFGMVVGRDQDLFAFWSSSERSDPGLNIALYANSTVDTLLERVRTEQNNETRLKDLATLEEQIAGDYPAAFTHAPDFVYAAPKGIHGIELPQIASPSDRFANIAGWYRYTQEVWPFLAKK